jgi:tetratricopeptide (TPR) repeat protein
MSEIEQGFGELRVFIQRLLIECDGFLGPAAFLADQSGVVEEFGAALAEFDEAAVVVVGVVEILLLEGQGGQTADGIGGLGAKHEGFLEVLAALAFDDGDYPAAATHCRTLAEAAPDRFEHWFNLGVACHKMGSHDKAAQAYRQAASLQPRNAQAYLNLGVAQQELNDLPGARASYEHALNLNIDPAQSGALWNLALVMEQQGERQWAEKLYARINEDSPEWCDASFRLGYLRLLRGDYEPSAADFEACLAQRADWPEAHLNAAIAYARSGNGAAARQHTIGRTLRTITIPKNKQKICRK